MADTKMHKSQMRIRASVARVAYSMHRSVTGKLEPTDENKEMLDAEWASLPRQAQAAWAAAAGGALTAWLHTHAHEALQDEDTLMQAAAALLVASNNGEGPVEGMRAGIATFLALLIDPSLLEPGSVPPGYTLGLPCGARAQVVPRAGGGPPESSRN